MALPADVHYRKSFVHFSDDVLDYSFSFADFEAAEGDAISSVNWEWLGEQPIVGDGNNGAPAPTITSSVATIWLLGGTPKMRYDLKLEATFTSGRVAVAFYRWYVPY